MKKIVIFSEDPKFIIPYMDVWRDKGYEVHNWPSFDTREAEWADIIVFDFVTANIIHATNSNPKGPDYAKITNSLKNKIVVARLHALEAYYNFPTQVDWTKVDSLIFVSDHIKEKVSGFTKFPESLNIEVIHNGIDLDKFTFKERQKGFNLGYVGTMIPQKGILIFMHYLEKLVREDSRYTLFMVGINGFHGREGEYFDHYLDVTGLKSHVIIEPLTEDVNGWMDKKDINFLIQPSVAESFSVVVGEAMAKGIKPIINNFWGSEGVWPKDLIYKSFDEFKKILDGPYESQRYRDFIKDNYTLKDASDKFTKLFKTAKPQTDKP